MLAFEVCKRFVKKKRFSLGSMPLSFSLRWVYLAGKFGAGLNPKLLMRNGKKTRRKKPDLFVTVTIS